MPGKKTIFTLDTLKEMGLQLNSDGTYSKVKSVQQPRDVVLLKKRQTPSNGVVESIVNSAFETETKLKSDKLVIAWSNKDISLNAWYSSKHWTHRNKQKADWHDFFKQFIHQPYPYFEQYDITLECNSRLDPSNCITMIKLCEDTLQDLGVLKNDTAVFCRGLHIIPVDSMKRRSYKITIVSK